MHELIANHLGALALAVTDRMDGAVEPRSRSAAAALLTLLYRQPLGGTELARIMGVAQPTGVRVIDGLVREGLVGRGRRTGRHVELTLTAAGKAEAHRLQQARIAALSPLVDSLDEADRNRLGALLAQLLAAATDGRATARRICRLCAHDLCDGAHCPAGSRATAIEREGGAAPC